MPQPMVGVGALQPPVFPGPIGMPPPSFPPGVPPPPFIRPGFNPMQMPPGSIPAAAIKSSLICFCWVSLSGLAVRLGCFHTMVLFIWSVGEFVSLYNFPHGMVTSNPVGTSFLLICPMCLQQKYIPQIDCVSLTAVYFYDRKDAQQHVCPRLILQHVLCILAFGVEPI